MERGSQGRALLGSAFNAAADWNPGYCGSLRKGPSSRRRRRLRGGNRSVQAPELSYAQHVARCHGEHLNQAAASDHLPPLPSGGFRHGGGPLPLRRTMTRESALSTSSTPAAVPSGERHAMYKELRAIMQVQQQNADAVHAAQVRSRARARRARHFRERKTVAALTHRASRSAVSSAHAHRSRRHYRWQIRGCRCEAKRTAGSH